MKKHRYCLTAILFMSVMILSSSVAFSAEDYSSTINVFKQSPQVQPYFKNAYDATQNNAHPKKLCDFVGKECNRAKEHSCQWGIGEPAVFIPVNTIPDRLISLNMILIG